jgi:hypothetical protein
MIYLTRREKMMLTMDYSQIMTLVMMMMMIMKMTLTLRRKRVTRKNTTTYSIRAMISSLLQLIKPNLSQKIRRYLNLLLELKLLAVFNNQQRMMMTLSLIKKSSLMTSSN